MSPLEQVAEATAKKIARKFLNLTIPAREELARLLVIQFQPIVIQQQSIDLGGIYFDGDTYDQRQDKIRLNRQLQDVFDLMKDSEWRTLKQISLAVWASEPSISARLRDLRKPRFGGHDVQKERIARGLWQYRLNLNQKGDL